MSGKNSSLARALGARLHELREAAGMSQSELAEASGVLITSVRNWEQGRRIARFDSMMAVAAALKVSLDELAKVKPAEPRGRPRKK